MSSTRKYEVYTGLFIIFVMGGGLLIGEIGLRSMQLAKYGVSKNVEKSNAFFVDKLTGLRRIHPNRNLGKIRINNLGFRGPDIPEKRPKDISRIAFLGSSTTYDAWSAEEKNWPHQTILLLKSINPECKYDFVNAAQPGHNTIQMLEHYQHYVGPTDPNLVFVLADDFNHDLNILASKQGLKLYKPKKSWLSENSVLFAKLEKNYRVIELQRNAFNRKNKLDISTWNIGKAFKKRLIKLVRTIKNDGRRVALITVSSQLRNGQTQNQQLKSGNTALFYMPFITLGDLITVREKYNEIIREVSKSENLLLIDGDNEIPNNLEHFVDTAHFSENGARKMAQRVIKYLNINNQKRETIKNSTCL